MKLWALIAILMATVARAWDVPGSPGLATLETDPGRPSGPIPIDPEVMTRGREVYYSPTGCVMCHQKEGQGMSGTFPPLVQSPWVLKDDKRAIKIVINGLYGEMQVNGKRFNSAMAPLGGLFNDQQIADVLTFIRNSWGNEAPAVSRETVAAVRRDVGQRGKMWSVTELLAEHPIQESPPRAVPSP